MTAWAPHRRLLTITEAALSIDRPASTIRRWISEGRLQPAAQSQHTRYYLESDVLTVEAATRTHKRPCQRAL